MERNVTIVPFTFSIEYKGRIEGTNDIDHFFILHAPDIDDYYGADLNGNEGTGVKLDDVRIVHCEFVRIFRKTLRKINSRFTIVFQLNLPSSL